MSRRPRGSARGTRGGGGRSVAVTPTPPVGEAPELIPGMKAWFDSRDTAYFALGGGGEVSAWLSRAGSLAGIAWSQGTGANQPVRVVSEPLFGNMPAVQFDGVNDNFLTSSAAAWAFLHDGSGCSAFRVYRMDSTGATVQAFFANAAGAAQTGVLQSVNTSNLSSQILNGSGTTLNLFTAISQLPKNVSRWHMLGYVAGTAHSRVSGSSLTNPDTGVPSVANPTSTARMGAAAAGSSLFLKGQVVQEIYYDHVLTAGETTSLANWAAAIYGVAA